MGQRVLVYGWVANRYCDGVAGTIIRVWTSEIGEWIHSVVLDAPQPDGICVVEATRDDIVKAAPTSPPRRARRRRAK